MLPAPHCDKVRDAADGILLITSCDASPRMNAMMDQQGPYAAVSAMGAILVARVCRSTQETSLTWSITPLLLGGDGEFSRMEEQG